MGTTRLLGLGDNTVDTYVDEGVQYPGGNAVNVAVLAARLGAAAGYLGCLGDDAAGDLLYAALSAEGVDLACCRRIAGANARALIAHQAGDRRFIGSSPGVRGRYNLGPEDFAYIGGFDLVHTSIYSELEAALPEIRAAARLMSFDFSERWTQPILACTLPFVDIAFLSRPYGSDRGCAQLLHACAAQGPGVVVATRGAQGAMAFADGRLHVQGIVPVEVVDTLGAGDGFVAGFLMAHLSGAPTVAALAAGAQQAAVVCGYRGAFGRGAPWRADISAARTD